MAAVTVSLLLHRLREVYEQRERPPLLELIHESTIEALELNSGEAKALLVLMLTESNRLADAEAVAHREGVHLSAFVGGAKSLKTAGLVALDTEAGTFDLSPVAAALRVETEEELEDAVRRGTLGRWEDDEAPPATLVMRPLKHRVIALARSAPGAKGLAKVYSFVFGRAVQGREWAMLGAISNALGSDKAALLMLENSNQPWEYPLGELIRYAKAQQRGFKSEEQDEVERSMLALQREASRKQKKKGETP